MSIFRISYWAIALALALFVGLSSFSIANRSNTPGAAYALGLPSSAAAGANVAAASFAMRQSENPKLRPDKMEQGLALRAFQVEPLYPVALSLLIAAQPETQGRRRQALLDLGSQLSRRNSYVSMEQLKAAALSGDNPGFFLWLSRLVLTDNNLRPTYIRAMADGTARPGAAEALAPVLGPKPDWAEDYWEAVVQRRASLTNAAELRIALANAPWNQTEVTVHDRTLAVGLAKVGEFETARRLSTELTGGSRVAQNGNLVQNSDFSRSPLLPPFDWQLATTGSLGSTIDPGAKMLSVSAIGGARGSAARQLVRLLPGRYRLQWSLVSDMPLPAGALTARIECAEEGVKSIPIAAVPIIAGKQTHMVEIKDGTCSWYWLSLFVTLADDAQGIDAYFRAVSLAPAAGGGDVVEDTERGPDRRKG